jgi:transposase-like protein
MTIGVRCGSCNRELLLVQLVQPGQGFRCLFCGFAFAPAYATVAPGVANRAMAAHAALVAALTQLQSMTGDRLRIDQATLVGPVANALPQVEAKANEPAPPPRRRAHRWPRLVALPRTTLTPRPQR